MSPLSTKDVAAQVGVHRATLEEWLSKGKVRGPKTVQVGERTLRLWTDKDIARVAAYKQASYRKGRGRKKTGAN